jgi:hypothetical protein
VKATHAMLSWLVVALVGVFVVAVVAGLSLFPRLNAAQRVLDHGGPVFQQDRVAGDRAGITIISHAADTLTPIVTPRGGAAAEVPALVAFVSKQTGLSKPAVLAALTKNFPHTTALLEAIPLSSVTSEIPGLVTFLAAALHTTPTQVLAALKTSFPDLYQSITQLPYVTNGWYNVPGTANLTRFNGTPVRTVPQVRTYFSADVIPVLEDQRTHFDALAGDGGVSFLAPLLLTVGIVVIIFGVAMALFARKRLPKELAAAGWSLVTAVGAAIVVVVLVLSLFPRLDGGQSLLDQATPAFNATRVQGDEASVAMVSHVVDFAAPAVTPQGGGAAEVPQLVAYVSKQTGLSQTAVLAALTKNFPHVTALLEAIPLSAVTSEIPGLVTFLASALHTTPTQVLTALKTSFPDLYQAITQLPYVTNGWNNIPGTAGLTTISGVPVHTVPQMQAYLATDVVPYLSTEQSDFTTVISNWPRLPFFPPLLLVVGIIVILYGALMLVLSLRWPTRPIAPRTPVSPSAYAGSRLSDSSKRP